MGKNIGWVGGEVNRETEEKRERYSTRGGEDKTREKKNSRGEESRGEMIKTRWE